jgi:hypothetical protein
MLRTEKTHGVESRKIHPMNWGVGVFSEVVVLQVKESVFVRRWVMAK